MNARPLRHAGLSFAVAAMLLLGACEQKVVPVGPLRAPLPPPIPTAKLTAWPMTVRPGQTVQLDWSTRYASYVSMTLSVRSLSVESGELSPRIRPSTR